MQFAGHQTNLPSSRRLILGSGPKTGDISSCQVFPTKNSMFFSSKLCILGAEYQSRTRPSGHLQRRSGHSPHNSSGTAFGVLQMFSAGGRVAIHVEQGCVQSTPAHVVDQNLKIRPTASPTADVWISLEFRDLLSSWHASPLPLADVTAAEKNASDMRTKPL